MLLSIARSTSTRIRGARNEQKAPIVVQKPIPAASAGPVRSCGGKVQNIGCTERKPTALKQSAPIATTGPANAERARPTAAANIHITEMATRREGLRSAIRGM